MICVALSDKSLEKCLSTLQQVEMAEIRLDLTGFDKDEIARVFSTTTPTIATCRPDKMGYPEQLRLLTAAIEAGATYVDIEIEAPGVQQQKIIELARKQGCKVIISYHNYDETPGLKELYKIIDQCYALGADIAKLATLSKSNADNARILSLFSNGKPLVALGMGEIGKLTRVITPLLGAEFTFAAMDDGTATAPGQMTYSEMKIVLSILKNKI